jgi:hypothetical protein
MERHENTMKAIEFTVMLEVPNISIPDSISKELESSIGKKTRVILLIDGPENDEESGFRSLAEEQFFQGYSKSDAIYDQL